MSFVRCVILLCVASCGVLAVDPVQFVCGDGRLQSVYPAEETCDDGNTVDGDGCNRMCKVEPGFLCPTENLPCACVSNNACNGNGVCNVATGICECTFGFFGTGCRDYCGIDTCPSARGVCDPATFHPGHCKCTPPRYPSDDGQCSNYCDETMCPPDNGVCGGYGECLCRPGFCGPRCQQTEGCGAPVCHVCRDLGAHRSLGFTTSLSLALKDCASNFNIELACDSDPPLIFEDNLLMIKGRDIEIGVSAHRHTARTYLLPYYFIISQSRVRFNGVSFIAPVPSIARSMFQSQFMIDTTSVVSFGNGTVPPVPPFVPSPTASQTPPPMPPPDDIGPPMPGAHAQRRNTIVNILQTPVMCSPRLSESDIDAFHQIIVGIQNDVASPGSLGTNNFAGIIHAGDATFAEVQCATDRLAALGMPVAFWGPGGGTAANFSAITNIPSFFSGVEFFNPGTYVQPTANTTNIDLSGALIMGYNGLHYPAVNVAFPLNGGNFTCVAGIFVDIPGAAIHVSAISAATLRNTSFIAVGSMRDVVHFIGAPGALGPFIMTGNVNADALQPTANNTAPYVLELDDTSASAVTIAMNRMVNNSFDHGLVLLGYPQPPAAPVCPYATIPGKDDERCFALANPRLDGRITDVTRSQVSDPAPDDFCVDQCTHVGPPPNTTYNYITVYTTVYEDRDVTLYVVAGILGFWAFMCFSIVTRHQWARSVRNAIARNAMETEPFANQGAPTMRPMTLGTFA